MSSLNRRRESPRRPIRSRGTHPGWSVFFNAYMAGILTLPSMVAWVRWAEGKGEIWDWIIGAVIGFAFLFFAARRAENLTEHKP